MIKFTSDIANIIPAIPSNVWIILCLTCAFFSTSATAYKIKPITNDVPAAAIPIDKAQLVNVFIAFKIDSTLYVPPSKCSIFSKLK